MTRQGPDLATRVSACLRRSDEMLRGLLRRQRALQATGLGRDEAARRAFEEMRREAPSLEGHRSF